MKNSIFYPVKLYPYALGRTIVHFILDMGIHLSSHLYYLIIRVISLPGFSWRWGRGGRETLSHCTQSYRENISKLFKHDLNRFEIFSHGHNEANDEDDSHRRSAHAFDESGRR